MRARTLRLLGLVLGLSAGTAALTAQQTPPPPLVTGQDLINLSLSPGPRFKEILEEVRVAQLEGTIRTHDEAILLVKTLL